jgi:DNA-binding transcriptional LysR family regulator
MPISIPTELLRTFLAIAESGSFSQAAEQVHRTQSAISMQIKKLEEILGKPLIRRDKKTSTLTADGHVLASYARRILQLNEEAVSLLQRPELSGWIKIGLPDDYAPRLLPEILARFSRTHPRVQVQVFCEPSSKLIPKLKQGDVDLILVTTLDNSPNQARLLKSEPAFWVHSPLHLTYEKRPLPLAMFPSDCCWRSLAIRSLEQSGIDYHIAYSSPSLAGLQAAVKAGLALTVLSQSSLPDDLQKVPAAAGLPQLPPVSLVLHKSPHANQLLVGALEDHIVAAVNQRPEPL